MKKFILLSLAAVLVNVSFGQDDALSKKVRFGIKLTPSLDWYKSGEKIATKDGINAKFGAGLKVEFRLTNVAVIATGVSVDMAGGTIKYDNNTSGALSTNYVTYYYNVEDDAIADYNSADNDWISNPSRYKFYLLNERKYQMTYVTIPLCLKLRTKEIGSLTYFGIIGVNNSIKYSAKATDQVQPLTLTGWGSEETISKTKIKDMAAINESLNIGAGTEWNLSGSTSLVFQVNYLLGFTNVANSESDYLRKQTVGTPDGSPLKQNLKSNSVALTVGVLF